MSEKIEPALTAEQWAEIQSAPIESDDLYPLAPVARCEVLAKIVGFAAYSDDAWYIPDPVAAIAACNAALPDDDPRKITREKLDDLRAGLDVGEDTRNDESAARAFLDALESYLPPDK